jgi:thioredoxin reductase
MNEKIRMVTEAVITQWEGENGVLSGVVIKKLDGSPEEHVSIVT